MSAESMSRYTITAYLRLYNKNRRKKGLMQQRIKQSKNFKICLTLCA